MVTGKARQEPTRPEAGFAEELWRERNTPTTWWMVQRDMANLTRAAKRLLVRFFRFFWVQIFGRILQIGMALSLIFFALPDDMAAALILATIAAAAALYVWLGNPDVWVFIACGIALLSAVTLRQVVKTMRKEVQQVRESFERSDLASVVERISRQALTTLEGIRAAAIPASPTTERYSELVDLELKLHRICRQIDAEMRVDPRATISLSSEVRNTLSRIETLMAELLQSSQTTENDLLAIMRCLRDRHDQFGYLEEMRKELHALTDHRFILNTMPRDALPLPEAPARETEQPERRRTVQAEHLRKRRLKLRLQTVQARPRRQIRQDRRRP